MKVIITAPTIIGGVSYDPDHRPQDVPESIGKHLVEIGNAQHFAEKVDPPKVTKAKKKPLSASQAAPASRKKTATTRKAKPKS